MLQHLLILDALNDLGVSMVNKLGLMVLMYVKVVIIDQVSGDTHLDHGKIKSFGELE